MSKSVAVKSVSVAALAAFAVIGAGVGPAAAAEARGLLPHPGPDGLVWVEEWTGDGGVASGGASQGLATVLTVACEGGGQVAVTMSQQTQIAAFTVDCPTGRTGLGSVTLDAGVVRSGSYTIGVDASTDSTRWALTVTQPE
ncbi:hypothetical protein [Streptomyces sp. NPDC048057]|uniref:hypothetical protein n=1 Tax=Streptomyces sp. NPDC048057 TaxID=3155628 RepID=UPI0033ED1607